MGAAKGQSSELKRPGGQASPCGLLGCLPVTIKSTDEGNAKTYFVGISKGVFIDMRVAQVIGRLGVGGVETVANNYYRHTDVSRIQFDYLIDEDSTERSCPEMEELGARYYIVPSSRHAIRRVQALIRLFRQNHYEIVHSHMNTLNALVLYAAWRAGVKVRISHNHSTSNVREWKRSILKQMLRVTNSWFATSRMACGEYAGRWFFGNRLVDSGCVTILPNAIDVPTYQYDPDYRCRLRRDMGLRNELVVGHAGRFMAQKNHEFLIEIFKAVKKHVPNAVLWLIGDGELRGHIEAQVRELGISDSVVFMGVRRDLPKLYSAMDCLLLPSLYEGVPLVGIEAQAAGLPCFFSEDVSREADLSGNVQFISLKESSDKWATAIVGQAPVSEAQRLMGAERLRGSAYDMAISGQMLEQFYEAQCEQDR